MRNFIHGIGPGLYYPPQHARRREAGMGGAGLAQITEQYEVTQRMRACVCITQMSLRTHQVLEGLDAMPSSRLSSCSSAMQRRRSH